MKLLLADGTELAGMPFGARRDVRGVARNGLPGTKHPARPGRVASRWPWNRLAAEMRANIRLGLAAGECVRVESPQRESPLFSSPFNGPRAMLAFAGVCAMLLAGVMLERPMPVRASEPMVQATDNGIQRRSGDRSFGLMHPGAQVQDVTYTVGAQGTMGARYVDSETGAMTMTKVYVE